MDYIGLIVGIVFILISAYGLINIDKGTKNNTWIDRYTTKESKRTIIKVLCIILILLGIFLILISSLIL